MKLKDREKFLIEYALDTRQKILMNLVRKEKDQVRLVKFITEIVEIQQLKVRVK